MKLLTAALVIVLLHTASAKPIGRRRHFDAANTNNDWKRWKHGWQNRFWWPYKFSHHEDSSSGSDRSLESSESSESSESQSSEESSEEILITDQTTPVMHSTDEPNMTATPKPITTTTPVVDTSTGDVTHCFTVEIPTAAPITENRGDN